MQEHSFNIQLAGKTIRIEPLHEEIREYCKAYIVDDLAPVDVCVQIREADIAYEKQRAEREAGHTRWEKTAYSDAYLETLAVYRKIAEWMPMQGVVLLHGSVAAVDGNAYLFTAKSGTGKSTHTRLWRECFGSRAVMVNDDKPLIQVTEDGVYACGTPWDGKHRLSTNIRVPLIAVCILKRGTENRIREIPARDAYPMLLQQCYRPADVQSLGHTMALLDRIMEQVSFYELFCNQDPEAAKVAYHGMCGTREDMTMQRRERRER